MAIADHQAEKIASTSRTIIDLLRLVQTLRDDYAALSAVLSIALDLNREANRQVTASRARYLWLLAQHRALVTGRTNAEERQGMNESEHSFIEKVAA